MMNMKEEQKAAGTEMMAMSRIEGFYNEMLGTNDPDYSLKIAMQLRQLQSRDGSWGVIEDRRGDSDVIVNLVYFPTYYATAALMRCALLVKTLPADIEDSLHSGLEFARERKLNGHGFDATADRLKALDVYKKAGLYEWMLLNEGREKEFSEMIRQIIEGFRTGLMTGNTWSDWNRNFREEFENEVADYDEHMCRYVWYAAYGSNLSRSRFMEYIDSCQDTSEPEEIKPYQIPYELYFAYHSRRWNGSGVAFIDMDKPGNTMGRIYKIRTTQFLEIQRKEGSPYCNKVMLEILYGIPVYSFTSPTRRSDINNPGREYLDVVLTGLKETYPEKGELVHLTYLLSRSALQEDDIKVLSFLRAASHGQSISQLKDCGIAVTKVKKSVKSLCSMGLIRQDSRSIAAGHTISSSDAVFYTCKDRRELIDILLLMIVEK